MTSQNMYGENIMDYYRNPRNSGKIKGADLIQKESNPLCGDELELSIKLSNGKIKQIKFVGRGCAISMASCSMMCESIEGKSIEETKKLKKEDILAMLGIEITPTRLKCALLCLDALHNAFSKDKK